MRLLCPPLLYLLLAACSTLAPAATPSVLNATPGPGVVITDRLYDAGVFHLRYPASWQVQTGPANQPLSVTFSAPDKGFSITVSIGLLKDLSDFMDDWLYAELRHLTLDNGLAVTVVGRAPLEKWDAFRPHFERVVASVNSGL